MSSWSVEWNHQDVDWVKRSTKHDFETEWAVNCCLSWIWQEIELTKDQINDHKHFKKDKQMLLKKDVES